jgi:hypothetical protein
MLYLGLQCEQTLNNFNLLLMRNKMSLIVLIAFTMISVSCKSEVKNNPEITQEVTLSSPAETVDTSAVPIEVKEITSADAPNYSEKSDPTVKTEPQSSEAKEDKTVSQDESAPQNDPKIREKSSDNKADATSTESDHKDDAIKDDSKSQPSVEVDTEKPSKPERIEKFVGIPNHNIWDELLKTYVLANGKVDYAGLKGKESKLDEYLNILENHPPETIWNRNDELAYWINAYNAYTVKLILQSYPVQSITHLHGGKPWDVKWINLDGKSLSLNNIENDIIRPKYKEPRIHFAVNCAAKSCPPLLNEAFKSNILEAQLETQTKNFVNNPAFNTLSKNEVEVSKIFDWYNDDFGDVVAFIMRYSNTTVKPSAKVSYKDYDWKLNGK